MPEETAAERAGLAENEELGLYSTVSSRTSSSVPVLLRQLLTSAAERVLLRQRLLSVPMRTLPEFAQLCVEARVRGSERQSVRRQFEDPLTGDRAIFAPDFGAERSGIRPHANRTEAWKIWNPAASAWVRSSGLVYALSATAGIVPPCSGVRERTCAIRSYPS